MEIIFQELARKLKTPKEIQEFIHSLAYNHELDGPTQKSALMTLKTGIAHCMEGALLTAAILEQLNHPLLILSLESVDRLDHLVFLFREKNKWGAIGKSRDEGLAGRAPVFRSVRDLAWSYVDPYVDQSGRMKAYQVIDIAKVKYDWRYSRKNLWALEQYFIGYPHRKLKACDERHKKILKQTMQNEKLPRQDFWW